MRPGWVAACFAIGCPKNTGVSILIFAHHLVNVGNELGLHVMCWETVGERNV